MNFTMLISLELVINCKNTNDFSKSMLEKLQINSKQKERLI
jgi:hypothetical protein